MSELLISWDLSKHTQVLKNKSIIDLACHHGHSSNAMMALGASQVLGVDIRQHLINKAIANNRWPNTAFFCNDITNYSFILPLIQQAQVVTCFGALYHLFDHFRFLKNILQPHIEYVILETLYGPETQNPQMFWGFEPTYNDINGYCEGVDTIANGSPNLAWIIGVAKIFNFGCDFVERHYANLDFHQVTDHETNKRMVVRLYNMNIIPKESLRVSEIWEWKESELITTKD